MLRKTVKYLRIQDGLDLKILQYLYVYVIFLSERCEKFTSLPFLRTMFFPVLSFYSGLLQQNVRPEDIHYVVCTHGHPDHVGNINLFTKAMLIMGYSIQFEDQYFLHDFKQVYQIHLLSPIT